MNKGMKKLDVKFAFGGGATVTSSVGSLLLSLRS